MRTVARTAGLLAAVIVLSIGFYGYSLSEITEADAHNPADNPSIGDLNVATAEKGSSFLVKQLDKRFCVTALNTGETPEEFYNYISPHSHTTTNIERSNVSQLFLFNGPNGTSLVVLHDEPNDAHRTDSGGGAATFDFTGLPTGSGRWVMQDDGGDFSSSTDTSPDWAWAQRHTDGGIWRGGLNGHFSIRINPAFNQAATRTPLDPGTIDGWHVLSGNASNPERIPLDLSESVTIRRGCAIEVEIDIMPGSLPNSIIPKSGGTIPVAILTTPEFDATRVDPATVEFGPGKATIADKNAQLTDVDKDGDTDMVLHFKTQAAGFQEGDENGILKGQTMDGIPIQGQDSVRIVVIETPWPMFHHDAQHTGRSPLPGPAKPVQRWTFDIGAPMTASPVIASGGTVYITRGNKLSAISSSGDKKWEFVAEGQIESSPAMAEDDTLYVGASPFLYAITPDGTVKWKFDTRKEHSETYTQLTGPSGLIKSSPVIGNAGTIYVGSGAKVFAINPDGSKAWNFTTDGLIKASPAVGPDGTIYVGSLDDNLYAINPDGTQKWTFEADSWIESSPTVSDDGTVYVGSGLKLYAVSPDGKRKWTVPTDDLLVASPAIGRDGTIYVGSWDGKLYAISSKGTQKWALATRGGVLSSPAVGADGTVYVGSNDGTLYAVDPDGIKAWEFSAGNRVVSPPAIGFHKTLYFGTVGGEIYAIGQ